MSNSFLSVLCLLEDFLIHFSLIIRFMATVTILSVAAVNIQSVATVTVISVWSRY